jgi:tetratricopeptide (TPR) repeat protein
MFSDKLSGTSAILVLLFILFSFDTPAQISVPPLADNQKSKVSQWMGIVELSVTYNSPDVTSPSGESRRGNIWGKLVPYGLREERWLENENQPTTAKPWRAGANETTVFATSHDILIEGEKLPAGEYGLFFIAGEKEWQLIFSKESKTWGHYFYNDKNDALRVKVTPEKSEYHEWLTYEFLDKKSDKSELALFWEDLKVPIHISIPDVRKVYIEKIKEELSGNKLRYWYNWQEAAKYCLDNNVELELGLQWAEKAINQGWVGNENFSTLKTKADLLYALNRKQEADSVMQFAVRYTGGVFDLHNYGKELLQKKKLDEAFKIFKFNATQHPDYWVTQLGMAKAYGAQGDFKTALKYAYDAKKMISKQEPGMRFASLYTLIDQLEKKQIPDIYLAKGLVQAY